MSTDEQKKTKTAKTVMTEDTAENEFQRFIDEADIILNIETMDEVDAADAKKQKARLIRAVMKGHLTIDDKGLPTFKPYTEGSTFTEPITFNLPAGGDIMAMDQIKEHKKMAQAHSVMGSMTRLPANTFSKLVGEDYKICQAIFIFFMD
ncbi:hypothetical protein KAR91_08325 [Candidatus Pacearchaeota archaeon]|nr:hypothetical protein [Candidatus Pacearchaeota archaeon]